MTKDGLLTKAERTALEKLLVEPNFKGKKSLRRILWMNTTKPKYKIGDCYQISDRRTRIFGVQAVDVKAQIVNVGVYFGDNAYRYELTAHFINYDGRETTASFYIYEDEIGKKVSGCENRLHGTKEHAVTITPDIGI